MSSKTAWGKMISRCYNHRDPKYPDYGARGIRVCDRWICYQNFLEDMGDRPDGMTLNRVDNNAGYSPKNCVWSSYKDQAQNTRNNRKITFDGRTECISEWERITGIKRKTIARRLEFGWPIEKALTVKPSSNNRSLENCRENYNV